MYREKMKKYKEISISTKLFSCTKKVLKYFLKESFIENFKTKKLMKKAKIYNFFWVNTCCS
jgi:spore cortex formation protein SpoVR/YcgB (stage V sporulation)